jgi:glycine dehydrogenase subunit 1
MRFLPHTPEDRAAMLAVVGAPSIDALYAMVPASAQPKALLDLPLSQGELAIERQLGALAARNTTAIDKPFFLGAGCYYHHIPATVDMVIQRSEFLTAYTPYQPEIAQGTLMVIFEFQSMIAKLTGMEVANASMYDGATSVTEAALMARRITGKKDVRIHGVLHPDYAQVLRTYWQEGTVHEGGVPDENTACVIVQTPDFHGQIHTLTQLRQQCDAVGAKLIVAITEIVSLGLLPAPVEADIVAGEAQSIGSPMSFGGPHLGFFACRSEYLRQMPGRLCGATVDADGKPGFVLTLSTREQHIRRDKATSNICSNQGLMALAFTVHLSLLGEQGFKQLAALNHENACILAEALEKAGFTIETKHFFNEFVVKIGGDAHAKVAVLAEQGILAGVPLEGGKLLVAATEMTQTSHIHALVEGLC